MTNLIILIPIIFLVILSATFSGLTIGMFSLSISGLERKMKLGDKRAARVYGVRKNGNFLLCTLLLGNAAVNSAIALCMGEISTGVTAGIISTGVIFLFGEVIPQAAFSRYALGVGFYTTWIVKLFMFIMWPVAKPLSLILDFVLGKEFPELFDKNELKIFIEEQHNQSTHDTDEKRIMLGALKFSEKSASDVMTPATIVYRIESDTVINKELLTNIRSEYYSRIPVYEDSQDNIIGILYAKDLIGYTGEQTAGQLCKKDAVISVRENILLDSLMNHLIKNKLHLALVYNEYGTLLGVVTLEDIMEEVLNIEILDEQDTTADLQHLARGLSQKNILTPAAIEL